MTPGPDEICGHLHSTGTERWICIRPPHLDQGPEVPQHRDRAPVTPNPERHYYIAIERYREDHPDV